MEVPTMDEPAHFALFGNPVSQSLSPLMLTTAFARMGIAADYTAYRVDDAAEVVRRIREGGIRGASITIPFKETVMALLDEVDPAAAAIGAVNTIVERDGQPCGIQHRRPGACPRPQGMDRDPGQDLRRPRRRRGGPGSRLLASGSGGNPHRRQPDGGAGPGAGRELRLPLGARGRRSAAWRRTA